MGADSYEGGSLDLVARTADVVLSVNGMVRAGEDSRLVGTVASASDPDTSYPVALLLDWDEVGQLSAELGDNGLVLLDSEGQPVGSLRQFSSSVILEGSYEIHAGITEGEDGSPVHIMAIADPVPLIIIGAAAVVAACAVFTGISWALEWLQSRLSGQVADCQASGNYPKVRLEFKIAFSLRRREFGCSFRPVFRCETLSGELISTHQGEFERVHAA
jgi:hypothetical protein